MKRLNEFVPFLVSVLFVIVLSSCGGGGSDSGGGGASFAGTYSGTWNATITGAGQSQSGAGTITIVVNPDGSFVIDPATPIPGKGTITGNSFTGSWDASAFNTPGITCSGSVAVAGTISGDTMTGNIGPSQFTCNGTPFTIQGTFTASKTAKALLDGAPVSNELQNAVLKAMSL